MSPRKTYSPRFKAQVVLESLRGDKSQAAICREHNISADLLCRWRQQFVENTPRVFTDAARQATEQGRIAELERLVGQLTLELTAAKKLSALLSSRPLKSAR